MPIKKSRGKAVLTPVKESRPIIMPRRSAFWTVFAFMMVVAGMFVIGAITVLLYKQQVLIASYIDEVGYAVTDIAQQKTESVVQETKIKDVYLSYVPCEAGFTGPCDDASIYRQSGNGSKQVIFPSVRGLSSAPLTGELLQPIAQSADGKYMVFGAWSFGSERGPGDNRIWIYDVQSGNLHARADAPVDAVYSPDFAHAAYTIFDNNDIKELRIVDLKVNRLLPGAKAGDGISFMGPNGAPSIAWKDASNVVVKEYSRSAGGVIESGEENIKIK